MQLASQYQPQWPQENYLSGQAPIPVNVFEDSLSDSKTRSGQMSLSRSRAWDSQEHCLHLHSGSPSLHNYTYPHGNCCLYGGDVPRTEQRPMQPEKLYGVWTLPA